MAHQEKRVRASARVQVTVEIDVGDTWGTGSPVEQVHRQAAESAINLLRRALIVDGQTNTGMLAGTTEERHAQARSRPAVRLVAEPRVTCVLVEEG